VRESYAERLAEADSVPAIGKVVRVAARRVTGAAGSTFVLRDGDLCFYADEDAIAPLWKGQRFPIDDCISGWAMWHRESVSVPDIEQDSRIPLAAYRTTFVRSLLMVPIDRAEPVGAIGAYWATPGTDHRDRLPALEELAANAAEAIHRVGLVSAPWAPNFRLGDSVRPR
jgi:GAF domain-containing protein